MFKVLHILSAFSILWISVVICQDCLYRDQTWGTADPRKIMHCNLKTNKSEATNCPSNRGYVTNSSVSGCVDWEDWRNDCAMKKNLRNITSCKGENSLRPHAVRGDPASYYLCSSNTSAPVILQCPENKGFVHINQYLGCVLWEEWRNITKC